MRMSAPPSTLVTTGTGDQLSTMTSRVDPAGARRIMEMLTNLYSDRRLAVVREYVSNAVDATRVAGRTTPVRVTTPTRLDPNLIVTDGGTGMTTNEVEATFLAFAASTKRDSNELIGGLGVGAKSAWTLTESFLVDTVKNGKRTLVRAARDLSHQVIAAGVDSDLPEGTTITVPVDVDSRDRDWKQVVHEVACAHAAGAVLVDGEPVESLEGGPSWIGPVSCRIINLDIRAVFFRSGGTLFASVPEVTERVLAATKLNGCLVELPVGSFDHTPSRETVIATDRTLAAVDAALTQFNTAHDALEQRIRELAEVDVEAASVLRAETLGSVGTDEHFPITLKVRVPADIGAWKLVHTRAVRSSWRSVGQEGAEVDTFSAQDVHAAMKATVVVTDVPAGRTLRGFSTFLTAVHPQARRVIAIAKGQDSVALSVTEAGGTPVNQTWELGEHTPWVQHYTHAQWVEEIAKRRTTRGYTAGYQCVVIACDGAAAEPSTLTAKDIAALNLPVWYVKEKRPTYLASGPASVGVYLGNRQSGPLTSALPQAVSYTEWSEQRFIALTNEWSRDELLAAVLHTKQHLNGTLIDLAVKALAAMPGDKPRPRLLTHIAALACLAESTTPARRSIVREFSESLSVKQLVAQISELRYALVSGYPLLSRFPSWVISSDAEKGWIDYLAHTPPQHPNVIPAWLPKPAN